MKKIYAVIPALCLGLVSLTAKADPTLTFNSSSGNIGPYNLTLSGSPSTNLSLFCMDDFLTIQTGESWTVDVIQGTDLSSDFSASVAKEYEEEAYILSQFNGTNNTTVQDALWEVFDPSTSNKTSASVLLYNAATKTNGAGATFIADGGYDSYVFYIYDGGNIHDQYCTGEGYDKRCSDPQNFIGDPTPTSPTPEPSSLFLLGSGLVGMAGAARRKFRRA